MPKLTDDTLGTKVYDVKQHQDILLLAFQQPELVDWAEVDNLGFVWFKFFEGPRRCIGRLGEHLIHLWGSPLFIENWRITGGRTIPDIVSIHGTLLQPFGCNLAIRVSRNALRKDQEPIALVRQERG